MISQTQEYPFAPSFFAPNYPRNSLGHVVFSNQDWKRRKEYVGDVLYEQVRKHPAKYNIGMMEEVAKVLPARAGDTIMDITSGTGTSMFLTLLGINIVNIEIEERYQTLQQQCWEYFSSHFNPTGTFLLIPGDCNKVLPLPGIPTHIMFSPPYSNILQFRKEPTAESQKQLASTYDGDLTSYSRHPDNLGNLSEFLYNQRMDSILRKCFDSLPSGGTLTEIVKDFSRGKQRVYLSNQVIRSCIKAGFQLKYWFKRESLGTSFQKRERSVGHGATILDEDIIVMEKP